MADNTTSLFERYIVTRAAVIDENKALDTASALLAINNTNHSADEKAMVRVASGMASEARAYTTSEWTQCGDFGTFPLTIQPNGTPYKLRVRFAASEAAAINSTLKVVVGRPLHGATDVLSSTRGGNKAYTFASSANSWRTPDAGADNIIALSKSEVAGMETFVPTINNLTDEDPIRAYHTLVHCTVWAKGIAGSDSATVQALYLAEFIG